MAKKCHNSKPADSFSPFYSQDVLRAAGCDAKCWLLPVLELEWLCGAVGMVLTLIQKAVTEGEMQKLWLLRVCVGMGGRQNPWDGENLI